MDQIAQAAATLSGACEAELLAGPEGASCGTYRQSMGRLNQAQIARNSWCISQLQAGQAMPAGCKRDWSDQGHWSAIEVLARKRNPDHWRQVDALAR